MTEREALLRAVCADPDDDTPRLVYADWLQEHGDESDQARAEFIRAQVRHAELLRHAAPNTGGFARRARDLWSQYGDQWRADLPQVAGINWHNAFCRGFPEVAGVVNDAVLLASATIFDQVPIRHLAINEFAALDGFSELPCVRRLKTLSLSAADPDGAIFRRLVDRVRLGPSTLLIVYGGLSGNDQYAALRAAFGEQLSWTAAPVPPPPPPPQRRRRK